MLISPTVDPQARSGPRMFGRWLAGGRLEPPGLLFEQAPDWRRAGAARLIRVVRSALAVHVEDLLPAVAASVTVVHAERDVITSHAYAARLAAGHDHARLVVVPGATHSWPYADRRPLRRPRRAGARMTAALAPEEVVASFDSATVLHAGLAAALRGAPFPHLGNGPAAAAAIRAGGRLPWPILRRLYTRIGASEGIDPRRLGDVDLAAVADGWPTATRGGATRPRSIGSSNGALAHLAAAMQVPWLPGTVLVPVSRDRGPAASRPTRCASASASRRGCWTRTRTWCCTTCTTRSRTS